MTNSRCQSAIPPWRGWGPIVVLPTAVLLCTPHSWPRWLFMWLLAFVIFVGCKWLTWRRASGNGASWQRHIGYLFAWPGLDANAFLTVSRLPQSSRPTAWEWTSAALKILGGAALFWIGGRAVTSRNELLQGWVGMVGVILMLHFGMFHLLSCAWRTAGIDAHPLMNSPLNSTRVSEFWGKRWNTAFRDLTHHFLFRPLTARLGAKWALVVGFGFSGLVHDIVISVPARGGYGGPTIFFAIQAAAMLFERSRPGRTIGLGVGWIGRSFTILALVLPAPILFHPPFVRNIIVPFMKALGAA